MDQQIDFSPLVANITLIRSDAKSGRLTINRNVSGSISPVDLTNKAFTLTIALGGVLQHTSALQIEDAAAGRVSVAFSQVATNRAPGTYRYDVEMTDTTDPNLRDTVLIGSLDILSGVTGEAA